MRVTGTAKVLKGSVVSAWFDVMVEGSFCAANRVAGYEYAGEQDRLHGHNFLLRLTARSHTLNMAGEAVAHQQLQAVLADILSDYDHCVINDRPEFSGISTSVENTARSIYHRVKAEIPALWQVELYETPTQVVIYRETQDA